MNHQDVPMETENEVSGQTPSPSSVSKVAAITYKL